MLQTARKKEGEFMEEDKTLTLQTLTRQMLCARMPLQEDIEAALFELGIRPTCGATLVFSMIQKACRGDTSAARFIRELNGEGGESVKGTGTSTTFTPLKRFPG